MANPLSEVVALVFLAIKTLVWVRSIAPVFLVALVYVALFRVVKRPK